MPAAAPGCRVGVHGRGVGAVARRLHGVVTVLGERRSPTVTGAPRATRTCRTTVAVNPAGTAARLKQGAVSAQEGEPQPGDLPDGGGRQGRSRRGRPHDPGAAAAGLRVDPHPVGAGGQRDVARAQTGQREAVPERRVASVSVTWWVAAVADPGVAVSVTVTGVCRSRLQQACSARWPWPPSRRASPWSGSARIDGGVRLRALAARVEHGVVALGESVVVDPEGRDRRAASLRGTARTRVSAS